MSSQLLLWVIPACIYLQETITACVEVRAEKGKKAIGGPTWVDGCAYCLCGFMGAVSLAFPLFLSSVADLPAAQRRSDIRVTPLQLACAILAFCSVAILPATVDDDAWSTTYAVSLFLLHTVLALPCFCALAMPPRLAKARGFTAKYGLSPRLFYCLFAGASGAYHLNAVVHAIVASDASVSQLLVSGWSNSCQVSISFDVVFTGLASAAFFTRRLGSQGLLLALLSPLVGIGSAFSLFAAIEL